MKRAVLIIGTVDTKGTELVYLRNKIEAEGVKTFLMDVSCRIAQSNYPADVSCLRVSEEIGEEFGQIAQMDKASAIELMTREAMKMAKRMIVGEIFCGIIGLGGANGAEIACGVMRTLPVGFPKLMVTCVASGNVRPYVGAKDIMMANSIGDISLNKITKRIFSNAARAIASMAKAWPVKDEGENKPQICISTFGVTLPCVERAKCLLEEKGFEVIELHSSGTGGMALEDLVRTGEISGVLDITTSELVDEMVGGIFSAGPNRLEAAGCIGIPQVISVGALDFANFGARETLPEKYRNRNFYFYTPSITLMRTNVQESRTLGKTIAEKANRSNGPTAIIIPQKGFSALDRQGGPQMTTIDGSTSGEWYDETCIAALIDAIKEHLDSSKVKLVGVDAHINDPEFAKIAVELLSEMLENRDAQKERNKK
ncbi:MAG: Tm-1-like ATP-binding domain-containing protein [Planctomycetes bacterium]|nr:Tm-1-like ATP-binding domain-containing protein [Planctomycetota bacterium]